MSNNLSSKEYTGEQSTALDTAKALMDATSKFFIDPSPTTKQAAIGALTAHMEANNKKIKDTV